MTLKKVNDKNKLEVNKNIYIEFLSKKEMIYDNPQLLYEWYLNLQDILFNCLGVNKSIYKSIDSYKKNSICYLGEVENKILPICDFLLLIEHEIEDIKRDLVLDNYKKSEIYMEKYFNTKFINNYDDIELMSITTTDKNPRIYYKINEKNYCDMKIINMYGEFYYKKAIGEFLTNQITFNLNKEYVKEIKIKEKEKELIFTIKNFEEKYGNINRFLYKELYKNSYKNEDDLINNAVELVGLFYNVRNLPFIFYKDELTTKKAMGEYSNGNIKISTKSTYKDKLEILIHEIGHFIHDEFFLEKQFRFDTKGKSDYAKKNHMENFAECFTDLVYHRIVNDRTLKMLKLLQKII